MLMAKLSFCLPGAALNNSIRDEDLGHETDIACEPPASAEGRPSYGSGKRFCMDSRQIMVSRPSSDGRSRGLETTGDMNLQV
jgi:hypothetical protein